MDINYFYKKFKFKVKKVWDYDIYDDSVYEGLGPSVWTTLVNIAIYLLVKEYNKKHKEEKICIVPENQLILISGVKRYSDFLLVSNRRGNCIEIEHENNPEKRMYKSVENLSRSEAEYKIIITYSSNEIPKQLIEKQIKKAKDNYFVKDTIYLMIAPVKGKKSFQYELVPI